MTQSHPNSGAARLAAARARAIDAIATAKDGKAHVDVDALQRLVDVTAHLNMGSGNPEDDPAYRWAREHARG